MLEALQLVIGVLELVDATGVLFRAARGGARLAARAAGWIVEGAGG
jgi:hypothetical protein